MKTKLIIAMAILLIAYPYILTRGNAVANTSAAGSHNSAQSAGTFSADELDNLLAPIALYPDPLLAQMLPAATFVDQITQAAAWLRAKNNPAQVNNQPWDVSVKALAGFPDVIYKMSDQVDWTTALGQAYVAQAKDVTASIQRLRQQAKTSGALASTPQQTVAEDQGYVTIMPAQADSVYVPQYNPESIVAGGLLSFGAAVAIGAWANNGWYNRWNWGGGGISNINGALINGNRGVLNRNVNAANLNRMNSVHRNTDLSRHGRAAPGGAGARPGTPGTGVGGNRPGTPGRPATGARPGSPGTAAGTRASTPNRGAAAGGRTGTPKTTSSMRPSTGGARATGGAAHKGGGGHHGGGGGGHRGGGGGGRRR